MEAGRALFEEGQDAFETVLGRVAAELVLHFGFECLRERFAAIGEKRFLHGANGKGRTLRDFLGESSDFVFKLRARNNPIHDAEAESGLRVDHLSRVEHFRGDGGSGELREEEGAAEIRKEAGLGEILTEHRFFRSDANIGGKRDIHARARRGSVNGGDDRLRHGAHLEDGGHTGAEKRLKLLRVTGLTAFADRREIASGTERPPGPGEDHDADGIVGGDALESGVEFGGELIVEGIEFFGAIEDEKSDAIADGFEDDGRSFGRGSHGTSLAKIRVRSGRWEGRGWLERRVRGALLCGAGDKLGESAKMAEFFGAIRGGNGGNGAASQRQDVDARAVEQFLLQAEFAFALGELLVGVLAIEGDDMRSKLLELLREHDAPFGKIRPREFGGSFRRALDEVGQPNGELDDPLIIVIVERLRDDRALVEQRPKLVAAAGIVMAGANGGFGRIAADNNELHAFAEMVGKGLHGRSASWQPY